ncbi:Zinc finger protein 1 [Operophtera brumata]|uniref:Zinc finger protein 1 n=1 Tax=Operophtera brumata TaxID=104452 RepID=A0A0L7LFV7_OPEBR|nr:Zinc finger protein 1 [Operophtera brumata]
MNSKENLNMDIKSVCWVCFEKVTESTDLSSSEPSMSKEIWEKISMCFQITVDLEMFLPCAFCRKCVEDLNTAYSFREKCVTIHERFQDHCESLANIMIVANSELEGGRGLFEDSRSEINGETNTEDKTRTTENVVCDVCNKILKTKKSLMKHMVSMHEKRRHAGKVSGFGSSRQYHCTTCSYSTPHSQTLVNHMRRHNGERPFKCECGKSFTQASSLAAHHKTHSSASYFTCSECGKQFKHAFSLKTHMLVHNDGTYSCHICYKVLKSKRSLTSHLHRHYKICNYNCEDCGATFVTSAELHNHKMKHGTKKNIVCHIVIFRHAGEKAYMCTFCDKSFLTGSNLRRHVRVHTREKPFSCQTCTRRFAHSSSLNNHMLTLHGVKYKWGDDKLKESRSRTELVSVSGS